MPSWKHLSPNLHPGAEYTIRSAKAGKHVICEKPMASDAQACREMIAACKQENRALSIGYRIHYEPTTQEIMRYGREKILGDVAFIAAGAGYLEGRSDHWKLKKSMSGGAMMDMGVYALQGPDMHPEKNPTLFLPKRSNLGPSSPEKSMKSRLFSLPFPAARLPTAQRPLPMG